MAKIKVLHIIKSLGRGGAEMLLSETLSLHNREKYHFHYIYFLPWKDQMVESLTAHGGTVTCLKANNNIWLILKVLEVAKYIKKHEIDIIHAHLPWAGIVARMASKLTGKPALYTEHNKQERYHVVTRYMNLLSMNWLTRVIAVSTDVARPISAEI
jgi:L-malate glycosyltransferase